VAPSILSSDRQRGTELLAAHRAAALSRRSPVASRERRLLLFPHSSRRSGSELNFSSFA